MVRCQVRFGVHGLGVAQLTIVLPHDSASGESAKRFRA